MGVKLCKDCLHVKQDLASYEFMAPSSYVYFCTEPRAPKDTNVITGKVTYNPANYIRNNEKLCGVAARWFIPKPPRWSLWEWIKRYI